MGTWCETVVRLHIYIQLTPPPPVRDSVLAAQIQLLPLGHLEVEFIVRGMVYQRERLAYQRNNF